MKKYRITKYNPAMRDRNGRYVIEEWTSYADIGKEYKGKKFDVTDYEQMESRYIYVLNTILRENGIDKLVVYSMEKYFCIEETEKYLSDKKLFLTQAEKQLFKSIENENEIPYFRFDILFKLLLRECLWCKLTSPNKNLIIEIGFDLYVYLYCDVIQKGIIDDAYKSKIYIEELE